MELLTMILGDQGAVIEGRQNLDIEEPPHIRFPRNTTKDYVF